jgi:hypothetical protein
MLMADMELLTLTILTTIGQVPDIEIQSLWERVCVAHQPPAKEEFLEALCTLREQGSLAVQELNGVWVFRLVADGEMVDAEGEYCEEFAQKILAIEANEKFTEIDCDAHLAYLDRLIEQARALKESGGKLD